MSESPGSLSLGTPRAIFTYLYGRNFLRASREIKEFFQFLSAQHASIANRLASRGMLWKLIHPYFPLFGGLWEVANKSAKQLLTKMLKGIPASAEDYATIFAMIEAILNSTPLCSSSADPAEEFHMLTPEHFLMVGPLLSLTSKDESPHRPPRD